MPATDSREVRTVEKHRQVRRAGGPTLLAGVARRIAQREVERRAVITTEPAMARHLRRAEPTGRGGGVSDLRARLQTLTPAERVAHLTPGKAVRITREFAGLSQLALAARAGLAQGTLSAIESGKATLGAERAKRLALALGVHPAALLFPDWPESTSGKRRP
jgi:ribosome-binding protein aMBF1 (putative translation factor)